MLSHALSAFFIKLAVGILPWLTLIHIKDTGKSFFRLLIFLSFASSMIALVIHFSPEDILLIVFIIATFVLFKSIGAFESIPIRKLVGAILFVFIIGTVVLANLDLDLSTSSYISFLNFLIGSLFLGSALVGMVTGHWYLIRSRLSFHYLIRATLILLGLNVARLIFSSYVLFVESPWNLTNALKSTGEMMLLTRFLWGGVLPLTFLILAYQCAKIHSNRSTTGILYFTAASIFMGELMGDYLSVISGIPL